MSQKIRCGAEKPDGSPCQRVVKVKGIRCYQHKVKKETQDPHVQNENVKPKGLQESKDVKPKGLQESKDVKPKGLQESKDDYCPGCGADEEWK